MHKLIMSMAIFVVSTVIYADGEFRPYKITAGISYYSNEYSSDNGLSKLGEEKNFEEVYQNYNYYEAVFDSHERIVVFKAYRQGAIEFSETYYYDEDGNPVKKVVKNFAGAVSVVTF